MLLLKLVQLCLVPQRQPDIVEAFNQAELAESLDFERKLDAVRLALRRGEIAEATKYGRVFELKPIST